MAERDEIGRVQIAELRRRLEGVEHELNREYGVRWRLHKIENTLTAHGLLMKLACAVSGIVGTGIGAAVVAVLR